MPFRSLMHALETAQGVVYDIKYLDPVEAKRFETQAKENGDVLEEMKWSIRPLIASGHGTLIGGAMDNRRFNFTAETARETFERVFGKL